MRPDAGSLPVKPVLEDWSGTAITTDKENMDLSSGDQIESNAAAENYEDEYDSGYLEDDGEPAPRNTFLLRIVALITAVALLGLVVFTSWPSLNPPLVDLIKESLKLKKDVDSNIMRAVVQISVLSRRQGSAVAVEQKTGTGFNISTGGVIITNYHVVEDALNLVITFPDGKVYKAEHWLVKPECDLAVLALQADGLPAVPVSQSRLPAAGDKIKVVGNPLSLNSIVVEGKVGEYLKIAGKQGKTFSIDAPIYPGNSGSPVLNLNGQVVGVVFGSMKVEAGGTEKVSGLAVTIDEAADLISAVNDPQQ
ncbi:MAG: serine protease [Peptococcaceae bacterium]|nr:serine protease [Peptococcaceae bacterium]